ncbi:hypothetical protein [Bradyrhizobium sp.]|uniref:hypothetical protein n=1 Tax=Bradyrhizobium sp. TaxID=376 RepID=UPI003C7267E4
MAYVTSATTRGGRNGRALLDNGALVLSMAAQLVEEAHTVCPYSKATKGNIPVKLTVV